MMIPNMRRKFVLAVLVLWALVLFLAYQISIHVAWAAIVLLPLTLMGIYDMVQNKHAIRRNYPLLGRMRYMLESLRPAIQQYFIENDLNRKPFGRRMRSLVYQRAKQVKETVPFGTQIDVYEEGYEWMVHSAYPLDTQKAYNLGYQKVVVRRLGKSHPPKQTPFGTQNRGGKPPEIESPVCWSGSSSKYKILSAKRSGRLLGRAIS
jgi:glutamate synthase domain-containing protein 2